MSNESLMSYLRFNASVQDYAASIAFKDADSTAFDFGDMSPEDTKSFSDFMDSLKESNDSREEPKTNRLASVDKSDKASGVEFIDKKSDAKTTDSTQSTNGAEKQAKTEHVEITKAERVDVAALPKKTKGAEGTEAIEVVAVSPEDMAQSLSELSEKLLAMIDALGSGEDITETEGGEELVAAVTDGDKDAFLALLSALIELMGGAEGAEDDESGAAVIQELLANLQGEDVDLEGALAEMSPEELAALKDQINAYLSSELSAEEQEALMALMAQYYPAALAPAVQMGTSADALGLSTIAVGSDGSSALTPLTAAKAPEGVNDIAPGAADAKAASQTVAAEDGGEETSLRTSMDSVTPEETVKTGTRKDAAPAQNAPSSSNNAADGTGAGARFLQANAAAQVAVNAEAALASQGAVSTGTVMQSVSSSMSTAGVQAQSTNHAHPATQMVSITMQKAIKAGEETNIKLQLDPPELGRVEVKMSIDGDNTAKIVLTAEKPETHQMLQRDAQFLEQAMSDAGLDAQGNLSFQLASDGQAFEQDSVAGGSSAQAGGSAEADVENDVLTQASTMDWYVDPKTGRMHYSILA